MCKIATGTFLIDSLQEEESHWKKAKISETFWRVLDMKPFINLRFLATRETYIGD